MKITDSLVENISNLSKLKFDSIKKEQIIKDLNKIVQFIDKLSEIYGLSNSDIISQTSLNANDVFDFNN